MECGITMTALPNRISLNAWIAEYQAECSVINSIHLLNEKQNKFFIAVTWKEKNDKHFNLFKHQEQAELALFCQFIARTNQHWHAQLSHWLKGPMAPLKLT